MSEILVSTIVNAIAILVMLAVNFIFIGIAGRILINKFKDSCKSNHHHKQNTANKWN